MMLEFKRLPTVGALEPPEVLILLVADHVALQPVHIGKHFPTYSTILRRKLELKDINIIFASFLPRDSGPRDRGLRGR